MMVPGEYERDNSLFLILKCARVPNDILGPARKVGRSRSVTIGEIK